MSMTTHQTRYANDSRVTPHDAGDGDVGYTVVRDDGETYEVLPTDAFAWVICQGPNLDFVPVSGGGFAIGISSADGAIAALIGEPREG